MSADNDKLIDLFNRYVFRIPQYQRAYAWEIDPNLNSFLDDLRFQVKANKKNGNKRYYYGAFLLEKVSDIEMHIVDGQQRMTTAVIFCASALIQHNTGKVNLDPITLKTIKHAFIMDQVFERQKFIPIIEDQEFFRSFILKINEMDCNTDSPSSKRMKSAFEFFCEKVKSDEWQDLLSIILSSKTMTYIVDSPADATQIFELQNDRGKPLTDLEALKSYLMHMIYLNSEEPEDRLRLIQKQFSDIYRYIERIDQIDQSPGEDSILSYHCAASLDWSSDEWRYPKKLIKSILNKLTSKDAVNWIEYFVADLRKSYETVEQLFTKRDAHIAFSELVCLGRIANFWPLLIKSWKSDKSEGQTQFDKVCRLLEVFSFRGYAMSNLRSDTGLSFLYGKARDFQGDYEQIYDTLYHLSFDYDLNNRFEKAIHYEKLYELEGRDAAIYLLWRYENDLRQQQGKKHSQLSWRDYSEPREPAVKLCIEHIAAQENPISRTEVEWEKDNPALFLEVATHRLGNLVIDSVSFNSSKGKAGFAEKWKRFHKDSVYLSQGELLKWVTEYDGPDTPLWTVNSVRDRHKHLVTFALDMWNPVKYHTPTDTNESENQND